MWKIFVKLLSYMVFTTTKRIGENMKPFSRTIRPLLVGTRYSLLRAAKSVIPLWPTSKSLFGGQKVIFFFRTLTLGYPGHYQA